MPLELAKETISLDHPVGQQSSQLLLEGDMVVPDSKPDIDTILRCGGQVRLEEERVTEDRVDFLGELIVDVIYQAKKSRNPLHSIEFLLPIEDFIVMEGIDKDTQVTLQPELTHLECKLLNDRKVSVKAVATVVATAVKPYQGEAVKATLDSPDMQMRMGRMKVDDIVENKKDRFNIKEEVTLSSGKPNIAEMLHCDVSISDKDIRPMEGRVMVRGNLKLSALYVGDTDESIVEVMEQEIPFSGYIDAKNATPKMNVRTKLEVLKKDVRPISDEDGEDRVFDCEFIIGADMKVIDNQEIEVVEDAYFPGRPMEITKEEITYPRTVGQNKNQLAIKETVSIPPTQSPVMKVEKVWANAQIDSINVEQDMVEVNGVVTMEALYIGENDEQPVSIIKENIPFTQNIELKGAKPDDIVDLDVTVEDASMSMLSPTEGEMRAVLSLDAMVTALDTGSIITEMDFVSEDITVPGRPTASAVIYVVNPGDTLWSIAKRYNTTVDDILLLNDIDNPDMIYPGQKILVLKRILSE